MIAVFEKFGLPVAFLITMIWLFVKAEEKFREERKEHRNERTDWRQSQEKLQTETNQVLRDLTDAINKWENRDKNA